MVKFWPLYFPGTARHFTRAIVMPNLKPPVTATEQEMAYRGHILAVLPRRMSFGRLIAPHAGSGRSGDLIR